MDYIRFSTVTITRFAFRFTPEVVYALIPSKVIGAYLLFNNDKPVYVGRSDNCLRRRLINHPFIEVASYFLWNICHSKFHAFCVESFWFHKFQHQTQLLNIIHPAKPVGCQTFCPFCETSGDKLF